VTLFKFDNEALGYKGMTVLNGISLDITAGEKIALVGESGAGKSTLLMALQSRYSANSAFIPQTPGLVRTLSVFHNIYMGSLNRHSTFYNLLNLIRPKKGEIALISPIAEKLGLIDKLFTRSGELSGGQQQRAAVCRALFQGGDAVLGDEPVSAVDSLQSRVIIQALCDNFETVVLALHDVELALEYSTRIIGIKNTHIALDAPTSSLKRRDLDFLYTA
jgi:phosphonate transport system ATP-binding protein